MNDAEKAVVIEIYSRFAAGEGYRAIAEVLNARRVPAPRAQQGRPSGWSMMTVMDIVKRDLYRGWIVWGKTQKAYGRQLGSKRRLPNGTLREKGRLDLDEANWIRVEKSELRIIDPERAERVDEIRGDRRDRYFASLSKGGRVPERAHGKFLLSGGMLVCRTCGANFEARVAPWRGLSNVYICSTRRRKAGICSNTLALPVVEIDHAVLETAIDEALGIDYVEELLLLVDNQPDETGPLEADRTRLRKELDNLIASIACGIKPETLAPQIKQRESELSKVEAKLRMPKPERPDVDKLRAALLQRTGEWREALRAEPKVARLVLRRLLGPLNVSTGDQVVRPDFVKWEADLKPGILEDFVRPTSWRPRRDSLLGGGSLTFTGIAA